MVGVSEHTAENDQQGYVRLNEPPMWCIQYPTCSACDVDLETDGDGWTCPNCGTTWPMHAGDGDRGTLCADADGPVVTERGASEWGYYREQMRRHKMWPDLVAAPRAPVVTSPGQTTGDRDA